MRDFSSSRAARNDLHARDAILSAIYLHVLTPPKPLLWVDALAMSDFSFTDFTQEMRACDVLLICIYMHPFALPEPY